MTSKTPNPSFIIINSHAKEKHNLVQHIDQTFKSSSLYFFESLSAYAESKEIIDADKVFIIFENCFNLLLADERTLIADITSKNAAIAIYPNADYNITEQLIALGISEILIENEYTSEQLKQSIYVSLSRFSKKVAQLNSESKNQFFDALSIYYGNLVSSVDLNLNFLIPTKTLIKKLESDFTTLSRINLRDYVHLDDLWKFDDIPSFFDSRNSIALLPVRIKVANNQYHNFEVNFIKNPSNTEEFIINLKDLKEEKPKEDFRRENNERFSAIAEATNSTIYEYFVETKQLFTSNSKGVYGLIEGEHLDNYFQQYYERIHPEDRERTSEKFLISFKETSQKPFTNTYRLRMPNGRYQVILERYRIFLKDGIQFKRIGALTDITDLTAQNELIALEKEIYEMNADSSNNFCDVILYLENRIEELIIGCKCIVLTTNIQGGIESVSESDYNKCFVMELAKHINEASPVCDKESRRAQISEYPLLKRTLDVTDYLRFKYFWSSPATNKENEKSATILLLFPQEIETEDFEETLVQRITILVGILTAKNKAVTETKTSRERFEFVAKATNDTIYDWNVQTDDMTWNKGIVEIFGYDLASIEYTSKWWFSHVHPEDSIRLSIKLYNFLEQTAAKWQDEYRFECADGSYKYVLDRGFLEKDSEGNALRMIGSMQDITQSKKEEERLKLLSAAITQANDAVIITETPRSIYAVPKIVYVNPAFSKMTGYEYEEVVGRSPTIFIGKNAMVEQQTILSKATEFNKEFIFEAINRRKNGEEYWGRFSMIPVLDNLGEHSHWVSIQSDITNQKEQETEKEHLIQELTRHNNDLKQFSYITSHNLRAPLSNLIGLLNLVDDIAIEDEDLKEIIEGFSKSTHLLNQTINDLIKIVIIKDNLSIARETINIQEIIQNILDQLAYTISQYSPIIIIDTKNAPILFVNKPYIESIFLNLITNALRYSSPNRVLEIDITSKIDQDKTILIFKDNGIGIDLVRNADKVFGLYQRFHDYPDSKGLGLYLVKSQVVSMGGSISIESELEKGCSFILTFKNKK